MNRDAVPSPCNGECIIDPDTGFCEGCLRTMTEISKWTHYNDDEKRAVLGRLGDRRDGTVTEADDD